MAERVQRRPIFAWECPECRFRTFDWELDGKPCPKVGRPAAMGGPPHADANLVEIKLWIEGQDKTLSNPADDAELVEALRRIATPKVNDERDLIGLDWNAAEEIARQALRDHGIEP